MKKKFVLTPNEEVLMNTFWTENRPLTSVELEELCKGEGWNQEYILNMLRSIKKKELVEVCGTVQYGKQYARSFIPSVCREEYAAMLAASTGITEKSLARVTAAMVRTVWNTDDVIGSLEKIIQQLETEEKEKANS